MGRVLASGNGSDDEKRFFPRSDRLWQWDVRRLVRKILLASKEAQEWPALLRDVIADCPTQHRIAGFKRIEHRAQRDRTLDIERHLATNMCQRS